MNSASTMPWGTRLVSCYEKLRFIGEGTYGQVWEGRDRSSDRAVAIKKTRAHKPGMGIPRQALREIGLLNSCKHTSMVEMIEVVSSAKITASGYESSLYIIFEYLPYDLSALIDAKYKFSYEEVRCFLKQLLSVLTYLHANGICHRDVKSSNLLIDKQHRLKLTDFGLARRLSREGDVPPKVNPFTNKVVTLWYRAPELLLGSNEYSYMIDMWSCGCIFVEMFIGQPLFQGRTEVDQMKRIFKLLGTPDVLEWPELLQLPNEVPNVPDPGSISRLDNLLAEYKVPEDAVGFVKQVLVLNPDGRCSGAEAMKLDYIKSSPNCTDLAPMRIVESSLHEYETKQMLKTGPLELKPVKDEALVPPRKATVSATGNAAGDQNSNARINGGTRSAQYSGSQIPYAGQDLDLENASRKKKTRILPSSGSGQMRTDGWGTHVSNGQQAKHDRFYPKRSNLDMERRYRSDSPYRRPAASKRRRRRS